MLWLCHIIMGTEEQRGRHVSWQVLESKQLLLHPLPNPVHPAEDFVQSSAFFFFSNLFKDLTQASSDHITLLNTLPI